jgi:endonuclease-3
MSMSVKEKATRIQDILNGLYPDPKPALAHDDVFTLLVATVLSAQTTDKKVNEITPRLFAVARTPEAMRQLDVATIHDLIREVGLAPQKAKSLQALSARLCEQYGGVVPQTFADLESLAGVGHKTASVVMAQGFGIPAFPVDTHVHRLAERWGLSDGSNVTKTEEDLKRAFAREDWIRVHLQMVYFGREYCPARAHAPQACQICSWAADGKTEATPRRSRPGGRRKKSG